MKYTLPLILLAATAHADPVATWGPSLARLGLCPDADACVTVINNLGSSERNLTRGLDLDGLRVFIIVENQPGDIPDTVTVVPPLGYRVDPPTAVIQEGQRFVFRLFAPLLG